MTDCALSERSLISVLRFLRGEGAGGVSLRGGKVGGSFSWGWEREMVSDTSAWPSWEGLGSLGLGSLGLGVAVRAASLPGSRMGFMAGLGGNGPIGRSGSSGFSVRWKSVVTRVGRLVSGENYRFEIFSKCMLSYCEQMIYWYVSFFDHVILNQNVIIFEIFSLMMYARFLLLEARPAFFYVHHRGKDLSILSFHRNLCLSMMKLNEAGWFLSYLMRWTLCGVS